MSFWQIMGRLAVSSDGRTINKVNETISVSDDGTTYTRVGLTTVGSDGSLCNWFNSSQPFTKLYRKPFESSFDIILEADLYVLDVLNKININS